MSSFGIFTKVSLILLRMALFMNHWQPSPAMLVGLSNQNLKKTKYIYELSDDFK